jgi:prevent-host-death family protein
MKRTVSAMEARKRLGELLEGVFYRNDEVVIERAGKPMAVVIPAYLYENIERERIEMQKLIARAQERNRSVPPELLEREIAEAMAQVRGKKITSKPKA